MTIRKIFLVSFVLTNFLILSNPAFAQKSPQKFSPNEQTKEQKARVSERLKPLDKKATVEDLIETYRVTKAIKELALTDEQAVKFIRLSEKRKEETAAINQQKREPMRELKTLMEQPNPPEDRIAGLVKTLRELDRKMTETAQANLDALMAELNPTQRAKFYLFQGRFEREIREVIEEVYVRRAQPEPGSPGSSQIPEVQVPAPPAPAKAGPR